MFSRRSQWMSSPFARHLPFSLPTRCPTSRFLLRRPISTKPSTRLERIRARLASRNAKFPRFVQRYTTPVLEAPTAQMISFLLLHEISAVLPLFALVVLFEYTGWLPSTFVDAQKIMTGMEKYGRWMRKKGWIKEEDLVEAEKDVEEAEDKGKEKATDIGHEKRGLWRRWTQREETVAVHGNNEDDESKEVKKRDKPTILGKWKERWGGFKKRASNMWKGGEKGVRLLMEIGTAYAIVKVLLFPRVILSVWATPWFARTVITPIGGLLTKSANRLRGGK